MIINTNISALQAWRNLYATDNALTKSLERLSTGLRINRAADDAAGLTVSEKMRAQINGLNQAVRNAQDAISLLQTAEGGLNEIHSLLQRMRELAVQAANDTLTSEDRENIQSEINALLKEVDRIAQNTEFNTQVLLTGFSGTFQIGANANQTLTVLMSSMTTADLKISDVSVDDVTNIATVIASLDSAIATVAKQRAQIGAWQNRLEHTITNLQVQAENMAAANSRIRDVDMAAEMMNFTRQQILMQSGTAMLAQANAKPQAILALLR